MMISIVNLFKNKTKKPFIHRFNDNLDKIKSFHDSLERKFLVSFAALFAIGAAKYFDLVTGFLSGIASISLFLIGTYFIIVSLMYLGIQIAKMYVVSKISAIVGSVGIAGIVADEITDYTITKFREQRGKPSTEIATGGVTVVVDDKMSDYSFRKTKNQSNEPSKDVSSVGCMGLVDDNVSDYPFSKPKNQRSKI